MNNHIRAFFHYGSAVQTHCDTTVPGSNNKHSWHCHHVTVSSSKHNVKTNIKHKRGAETGRGKKRDKKEALTLWRLDTERCWDRCWTLAQFLVVCARLRCHRCADTHDLHSWCAAPVCPTTGTESTTQLIDNTRLSNKKYGLLFRQRHIAEDPLAVRKKKKGFSISPDRLYIFHLILILLLFFYFIV